MVNEEISLNIYNDDYDIDATDEVRTSEVVINMDEANTHIDYNDQTNDARIL